jgi:hypothetical protein
MEAQLPVPCYAKVGRMHSPDLGLNPRTEPCLIAHHERGAPCRHNLGGDRQLLVNDSVWTSECLISGRDLE